MQERDNRISTECLPGIPVDNRFCVDSSGKNAFIFDFSKISFVQVSLSNGRHTKLDTEFPKRIEAPQDWCCIHAVTRTTNNKDADTQSESSRGSKTLSENGIETEKTLEKTYILALVLENGSSKFFLVSFAVDEEKISVVHEFYTNVDNVTKKPIVCSLFEDERRQIYCIIYWNNLADEKTIFHSCEINISERGKISANVLSNTRILDGNWFHPFVFDDAIHWLPRHDTRFRTLLEVSLLNEKTDVKEIKVSNEHTDWISPGSRITLPTLLYGNAVFYVCNEKLKSGLLCYFDCKRQCWQKVALELVDHFICGGRIPLKNASDGRLCLHGACINELCEARAHIYVLGIRREFERNAARWDDSELAQKSNTDLKKLGQDLLFSAQWIMKEQRQSLAEHKANDAVSIEMKNF